MKRNLILSTDSYKASHYLQYPPGTERVSSYITPRYNAFRSDDTRVETEGVVNFGLQMFIDEYLLAPITAEDIAEAKEVFALHGEPFNEAGWNHILKAHKGYMPVEIQAEPEGSVIQIGQPQVQIMNHDPLVPWLTSYLETSMLRSIWYPSTVATVSREIKRLIVKYLKETADGDPLALAAFKLHDFGARGVSSSESAMIGGAAHLVNFMGTDTVEALRAVRRFYNATMPAFSIPAAEHSTITAWGEKGETAAYENMINQFGGSNKLVAVVSDSYDLYNAVSNIWGGTLAEKVKSFGGTLVIRPDSGHPPTVVLKVLELLKEKFPVTLNSKGYKMLPSYLRVIQGDGINYAMIKSILRMMKEYGWSADNIAFGMGGALLQQVNRDTFGYAMKANAIDKGQGWIPVYKNPKTDPLKASRPGRISFDSEKTVYSNDRRMVVKFTNFDEVRRNAEVKAA